jgi:CHAT domain-containing protein
VVWSLWPGPAVEHRALLEDFYGRVAAGRPARAALREAQRAARGQGRGPAVWGAFVCVGAPDL